MYASIGFITPFLVAVAFFIPLLTLLTKRKIIFDSLVIIATLTATVLTWYNYFLVKSAEEPIVYTFGGWPPPVGIVYEVDELSAILAIVTSTIMFLVGLYSIWYLKDAEGFEWFYTLYLGLEAGMIGCIYTGDAFNLFVMLEVMSVSAYALVAFYRSSKEAVEAGIKYAIIGAVSTTVYFIALMFIYGAFGTLNMAELAARVRSLTSFPLFTGGFLTSPPANISLAASIALALSLWAFTFKAALFPNHFWLPDAHPAAPTPVSAILSGLVVNVGAYAIIRFLYTILGWDSMKSISSAVSSAAAILVVLGGASALIASALMLVQKDIKRLIAYSTILHLGLIVSAASLGTNTGLAGSMYHIVTHAVGKALLFLTAGVVIKIVGSRNIDDIAGVARKAPLTIFAMVVAVFSLVGIPPFGGFFSKLVLYQAYITSPHVYMVAVLLISSALALLAYTKILYVAWFRYPVREFRVERESPLPTATLITMAIILVLLGILSPIIYERAFMSAAYSVTNYLSYVSSAHKALASYLTSLVGGG
ncbi:MAG: cation:proton antiporter [Desulfurococcales archaeon]|nr:cation:proton antiporter [Desulfurococcales archaeon]